MSARNIRLIWRAAPVPQRTMTEELLVREIEEMTRRAFLGVSPGPITIEGLDEQHRVTWRAYYEDARALRRFVTMLNNEAPSMLAGERRLPTRRSA